MSPGARRETVRKGERASRLPLAPAPPYGRANDRQGRLICGSGNEVRETMLLSGESLRLPVALDHEWLLTNGLGGYAMGTVAGIATRGYHGWLVAAEDPPHRRRLRLSKVEIGVTTLSGRTALSSNLYPDAIHPDGADHLLSFSTDPVPTWRYRVGTAIAEVSLRLLAGRNACVMELIWEGDQEADVDLRPLVNDRDHHGRTHRGDFTLVSERLPDGFLMETGLGRPMRLTIEVISGIPMAGHRGPEPLPIVETVPDPEPVWIERMRYPEEAKRGYPALEDHASPGRAQVRLGPGGALRLTCEVGYPGSGSPALSGALDSLRVPGHPEGAGPPSSHMKKDTDIPWRLRVGAGTDELRASLGRAARDFRVRDASGRVCVVAGYPFFEEWARDTFISIPGLFLSLGDLEGAHDVLEHWGERYGHTFAAAGFDGAGRPFGLTADAPLHFVLAVYRLWAYGGDVGDLLPVVRRVLSQYLVGFGPGRAVHVGEDGLVNAALSGRALTWMDAASPIPHTPRDGAPVEVSALWYKCLCAASRMGVAPPSPEPGEPTSQGTWDWEADRTRTAFRRAFLRPDGLLYDRLGPDGTPDPAVRPNQLYACGWPFPLLDPMETSDLLEALEPPLWTARGLRTLSPDDPRYRGRYEGTQESRDAAYHQGTVWPYLIGVWADAQHHAYPEGTGRQALKNGLEALRPMVDEGIVGQMAELYDGDPPQRPRGALAQAWSVAELLRVLEEWVYGNAPPVLKDPAARPGLPEKTATSEPGARGRPPKVSAREG